MAPAFASATSAPCSSHCSPPSAPASLVVSASHSQPIPRKNGWQIAEHARLARPYGIQRLLSRAVWDQDGVRDDLRTLVSHSLLPSSGDPALPFPVLVLDESGFPKRGRCSPGVALQYCWKDWSRGTVRLASSFPMSPPSAMPSLTANCTPRRLVLRSATPTCRSYSR